MSGPPAPVLDRIVGQDRAVSLLRASLAAPVHAYLFLGPPGSGKEAAARAFSAALVCPEGGCGACATCRDVLTGRHPDVTVIERTGAAITVEAARSVAALSQRAPRHGSRQVIVFTELHLAERAAPALLKTVEEPPSGTVFLLLADACPPSLATIASRCLEVELRPLGAAAIEEILAGEGVAREAAAAAAAAGGGRLDRARLLSGDGGFSARQERWRAVPERLDGTGATVALLAEELLTGAEELLTVLAGQQEREAAAARELAESLGERVPPGRQAMAERHRREQRRLRTDELRAGLATLAGAYRSRMVAPGAGSRRLGSDLAACRAIDEATAALVRNPNETLLLQSLLLALDRAATG